MLRANIVEFGTNNKLKGQAELQLISSTKVSEIATLMLSVYNVSSVLTSQYYLSQINNNLSSILENISEIQNFLEEDKRSIAEANTEFLTEVYSNLDYYMENTIYTQATLINIQGIRIKSLADMKFYYRQINGLKNKMSPKDKKSKVNENKELFKKNYYAYNYALKSYNLSVFIEILMSGQFDEVWLTKHLDKIIEIMVEFTETYDLMLEYFDELKILKTKDEKEYKELLESFPQKEDIKVELGIFLAELSSEWLLKKQNKKKEKNKQEYVSEMQRYVNEYSNPKDLLAIPLAIEQYSKIHNKRVEIMYHDERIYIKD